MATTADHLGGVEGTSWAGPVPLPAGHIFEYIVEHRAIVCRDAACLAAYTYPNHGRHVREKHSDFYKSNRTLLAAQLDLSPFSHATELPPPLPGGSLALPYLAIHKGYTCLVCGWAGTGKDGAVRHRKACSSSTVDVQAASLQRWGRDRGTYWAVQASRELAATTVPMDMGPGPPASNHVRDALASLRRRMAERRAHLLREPAATELTPWLQVVAWHEVCRSDRFALASLSKLTAVARDAHQDYPRLRSGWRHLMDRATASFEALDNIDFRKWLATTDAESCSQKPLRTVQPATMRKYTEVWERYLYFLVRTCPDATGGGASDRYLLTLDDGDLATRVRDLRERVGHGVDGEEGSASIAAAILAVARATIQQNIGGRTRWSSPMMVFLAFLGIAQEGGHFHQPRSYTKQLAAVSHVNRLLFLEFTTPSQAWPELGIEAGARQPDVLGPFLSGRKAYLSEGSFGVQSLILSQLAYGIRQVKAETSDPNVRWSADGESTLFYQGVGLDLKDLKEGVASLERELVDLAFGEPLPRVPLDDVVDCVSAEFSHAWTCALLDDARNERLREGAADLLRDRAERQTRDPIFVATPQAGVESTSEHLSERGAQNFLARDVKWRQLLLVVCHLTAGQPARAPEIGSVAVTNTQYGLRNIFVINGKVCLLTTYDKCRAQRGSTRYVARFLPSRVSQALVQYVLYVRPLVQDIGLLLDQTHVREGADHHLFHGKEGRPWTGRELTTGLVAQSQRHFGVRLNSSSWRHIAIALGRKKLGKRWVAKTTNEADESEDEEAAAQLVAELTGDVDYDETDPGSSLNGLERAAMVRQSAHGPAVAAARYAIDASELHSLGPDQLQVFEAISARWHAFLNLSSADERATPLEDLARDEEGVESSERASKRLKVEPPSATSIAQIVLRGAGPPLELLRRATDPLANWRSNGQREALVAMLEARPATVVVLGTGAGKSAIVLALASIHPLAVVVMVLPYLALLDDMKARADRANLCCRIWSPGDDGFSDAQLVLVSADQATRGDFMHQAQACHQAGRLLHIVVDEAHTILTDVGFRPKLGELEMLRHIAAPFTAMTATLPPAMEVELRQQLHMDLSPAIRESTTRGATRYSLERTGLEGVVAYVSRFPLLDGSRGIVYVRSIAAGKLLDGRLGCGFYHATAEDKDGVLSRWKAPKGGWIIATGAMGTGINIERVQHVVHLDRPYGLITYAQQTGRGGRGGEPCEAILFCEGSSTLPEHIACLSTTSAKRVDEEAMSAYIATHTCRRALMSSFLDGLPLERSCSAGSHVLCDICESAAHVAHAVPTPPTSSPTLPSELLVQLSETGPRRSAWSRARAAASPPDRPAADRARTSLVSVSPASRARSSDTRERSPLATSSSPTPRGAHSARNETWPRPADPVDGSTVTRGSTSAAALIRRKVKMDQGTSDICATYFRLLSGTCQWCRFCDQIDGHEDEYVNDFIYCDRAREAGQTMQGYREFRRGMDFLVGSVHYFCGLPSEVCGSEGRSSCEFRDTIMALTFFLYKVDRLWQIAGEIGFPTHAANDGPEARLKRFRSWIRAVDGPEGANWNRLVAHIATQHHRLLLRD